LAGTFDIKIQRAEQMKVHTLFVIGKHAPEADAVSVRVHGKGQSRRKAARAGHCRNFEVDQGAAGLICKAMSG
jgi:hypothetical protein